MSTEPDGQKRLSDDERAMLVGWIDGMTAVDPRFKNKALLKLVARATTDGDFRRRLLTDTQSVLAELPPDALPANVELAFSENTPSRLNVVLPAPGGGLEGRPPEFRDKLRSRTSESVLFNTRDDWDFGDVGDPRAPGQPVDLGDVGGLDGHPANSLEA